MKVAFENIDLSEPNTICDIHLLPDELCLKSEDETETKVFMHAFVKFVKYLMDNELVHDPGPIDGVLASILFCGEDIRDYSLVFKKEKHIKYKYLFTILRKYGEELGLEYPNYLDDIDPSLFSLITE